MAGELRLGPGCRAPVEKVNRFESHLIFGVSLDRCRILRFLGWPNQTQFFAVNSVEKQKHPAKCRVFPGPPVLSVRASQFINEPQRRLVLGSVPSQR